MTTPSSRRLIVKEKIVKNHLSITLRACTDDHLAVGVRGLRRIVGRTQAAIYPHHCGRMASEWRYNFPDALCIRRDANPDSPV
jgi:hypothetical protein